MADLAPYRYVTNKNLDEDLVYQKLKEIGYANEVIQVNDVITRSVVVSMNAMNVVMDLGLQAGNQQYQEQLYPLDIQDFQGAYAKEEFVDYFICDDFYHSANAVKNVFPRSCFFDKAGQPLRCNGSERSRYHFMFTVQSRQRSRCHSQSSIFHYYHDLQYGDANQYCN